MKKLVGFHGEVIPVTIKSIPTDAKRIELKKSYIVVGESEVTGNDHRVKVEGKQVEFYEKNGTLYMKNLEDVEIGCVIEERHDTCILPSGTWEFKKAIEFDPISEEVRQVRD